MTADPVPHPRTASSDWEREPSGDDGWVEFTIGSALAYAWVRFWTNAPTWALLVVASAAISVFAGFVANGFDLAGARGFMWSGSYSLSAVSELFVMTLVNAVLAAVLTRAALDEAHGRRATLRGALRLGNVGAVLLGCLLIAVGYEVGTLLLVLPGLVFAFLAYYTLAFVVEHGQDAVTALRSSAEFVAANVGRFLMLTLAVVGINLAGALLFGIGLVLTIPVTLIATMHAFRTLQGERVA